MTVVVNRINLLWMIGVMQPISVTELLEYIHRVLGEGAVPSVDELIDFCQTETKRGNLLRVKRGPDLYSLTSSGNARLSAEQHKSRDAQRVFLLRQARAAKQVWSRGRSDPMGSGGASPSMDAIQTTEGTEANKSGLFVPRGRTYWPRFSRQLLSETGPDAAPRDDFLEYLSFASHQQLQLACGRIDPIELSFSTLGTMLGLSPKLIQKMALSPHHYYRSFEIEKSSGGLRTIEAPRAFLKIVQHFLLDFVLSGLPISRHVHSFYQGRSIVSNARRHSKKGFVAGFDVENFFGSIQSFRVHTMLVEHGFTKRSAETITLLCCKNNVLPQGAPTSPMLSNLYLYNFDENMAKLCKGHKLAYTRYADDITISGDCKDAILECIEAAENWLDSSYGLRLNEKKTRIVSRHAQQRVTGLVVNDCVMPPRHFRRFVRAAFHRASTDQVFAIENRQSLVGYFNYLKGFPALRNSGQLRKFKTILRRMDT
jgi:hypothetical protein